MHSPSINCGRRKLMCKEKLFANSQQKQEGEYKNSSRVSKAFIAEFLLQLTTGNWAASAPTSVEETRWEIKVQNYPALVFAFLCWCSVADWPSLAQNMMLSVLRIFLNQHWRVAARKVEVAVSQSCFCRKGDCLKGGLFDLSIFQICISLPRLCHSL